MKRIGIIGGTFNPIHMGHLAAAQAAGEKLKFDKVIFIPSNQPPHKNGRQVIPGDVRYEMVRLAIQGNSSFAVSDYEVKRPGKSYSIDTVHDLVSRYPKGTKFFFIIGWDSYLLLHQWKSIDDLLRLVTFVVVNRPGYKKTPYDKQVCSVMMPGLDISSSWIRNQIKKGRTIRYFLPDQVIHYIEHHRLYR